MVGNFLDNMNARTSTVLNTVQGSIQSAVETGSQIEDIVSVINSMRSSAQGVQGQLQAQQETNQLQGEMLNQVALLRQANLEMMGNQAAFEAYEVQMKQTEVNSTKKFLNTTDLPSPVYADNGQGDIKTVGY